MSASREKKKRQEQKGHEGKSVSRAKDKRRSDKFRRGVAIAISCIILLAIVALGIIGSGTLQKNLAALTIDGVDITVAEYNFHYLTTYTQYGQYFGWDLTERVDDEIWTGDMTVRDYIHSLTIDSLKKIVAESEQARREGVTLNDEEKADYENNLSSYEYYAAQSGLRDVQFYESNFGRGVTLDVIKTSLERVYLATAWERYTKEGFSQQTVDETYEASKDSYDLVSYHAYTISGAYSGDTSEMSDEEVTQAQDAAKAEAKAKAEQMLSSVTGSGVFGAVAKTYEPVEDEDEDEDEANGDDGEEAEEEDDTDDTLYAGAYSSDISSTPLKEYLFDSQRETGDKSVIEDGSNYTVVLFLSRYRDETSASVDVRHILAKSTDDPTNSPATEEQTEDARARAEEILAEWEAGEKTEDSFAALAGEKTEDPGSADTGGLYEGVAKGEMVAEFESWCFDASRQPGDTGLVDTAYGTHVMYFVKGTGAAWDSLVRQTLLSEKSSGLIENVAVKEHSFALSMSRTTK